MTKDKAAKLFEHSLAELISISKSAEADKDRIAALKTVAYYSYKLSTEEQSEESVAQELQELKGKLSRLATARLSQLQLSLVDEDGDVTTLN